MYTPFNISQQNNKRTKDKDFETNITFFQINSKMINLLTNFANIKQTEFTHIYIHIPLNKN